MNPIEWLKNSNWRAACLLLLLLMMAFYDVVFLNKTFKVTTANSQALPTGAYGQQNNKPSFIPVNGTDSPVLEETYYEFYRRNIHEGRFPLWNPHQACGFPIIAMIEAAFFFPLTVIMYLFPSIVAWDILILARFWLAGLFTYWFMRSMGYRQIPSLGAAVAFMLSGPMVLLQYWTVNVDIMLPVLLIALERIIRKPNPLTTGWLGLAFGLTILAGHPEHIFLVNVFGVAFLGYRLWIFRRRTSWKKTFAGLSAGYLLGLGLGAIALWPFLRHQLTGEFWNGHPNGTGALMEEQAARFITLALPHFFQAVPLTYQWQFAGWWGGYLGIIPLALASVSLIGNQRRGLNYFFAVMAFLIISKEYGLPFINWIGYLPIFNVCRYAIHTTHLAAFCIAVLAGMGIRNVMTSRRILLPALIFSIIMTIMIVIHVMMAQGSDYTDLAFKAAGLAGIFLTVFLLIVWLKDTGRLTLTLTGVLLIALIFTELFSYIHRERPRRFDSFGKVPYFQLLKSAPEKIRSYGIFWAFYPNTATGFGVDDLGYFFSVVPKRFVKFVNTLLIPRHFRNDLRPPALRAIPITQRNELLDLLNVKFIIAPSRERLQAMMARFGEMPKEMVPFYDREVCIFNRPNVFPRAYIVHRAAFQPNEDASLEMIRQAGAKLRQVAVINHAPIPQILSALQNAPETDASDVRIVRYEPDTVVLNAYLEHPGFVILSDAYHPDWKVSINGKEWKIFQTDYLLRSVFLPAGRFQITYTFHPTSFYYGRTVTLVALAIILFLLFWRRPRIKK